jgi:hypothetical protein
LFQIKPNLNFRKKSTTRFYDRSIFNFILYHWKQLGCGASTQPGKLQITVGASTSLSRTRAGATRGEAADSKWLHQRSRNSCNSSQLIKSRTPV